MGAFKEIDIKQIRRNKLKSRLEVSIERPLELSTTFTALIISWSLFLLNTEKSLR
jgi:hypothetical protein